MTFLPIVVRELRVAARKRRTFWLRVVAALVALVIGGAILILSSVGAIPSAALGGAFLWTLAVGMLAPLVMPPFFGLLLWFLKDDNSFYDWQMRSTAWAGLWQGGVSAPCRALLH